MITTKAQPSIKEELSAWQAISRITSFTPINESKQHYNFNPFISIQ